MSKFSDYSEAAIINWNLRGIPPSVPTGIFLALFTDDPTDANIVANELKTSGGAAPMPSYTRMNAAGAGAIATGWTPPSDGVTKNTNTITFPANNGTLPVTIGWLGIYDALTGGNLLYHSPLVSQKVLQPGDVLSFGANTITITIA
ncbi:hypothetical protein AAKU55_005945 [Oxalobacteraceae bacterium GrIS 1.11]